MLCNLYLPPLQARPLTPVLLVEVKRSIGAAFSCIEGQHLGQVFVQAYYALSEYCIKELVVGLTDATTWHFLHVSKEQTQLKVEWGLTLSDINKIVASIMS